MNFSAAATASAPSANRPIRVMLVDDSMVARTALRRALAGAPGVEIVASIGDGRTAIETVAQAQPDVLLLDIAMPVMDGIEALPHLLRRRPGLKVIVVSTLSRRNAEISLAALKAGAIDVMLKPSASDSASEFAEGLQRKVLSLGRSSEPEVAHPVAKRPGTAAARPRIAGAPRAAARAMSPGAKVNAIAIGSSTGGPQALSKVFEGWGRKNLSQPVFITQHMPPTFTRILAEQLTRTSGASAHEAEDGEKVSPGRIYVAPGDRHMLVKKSPNGPVIQLHDGPQVNFCRPAVDPMLQSLIGVYGADLLVAILTGMGRDGAAGALAVKNAGGHVLAQDQATSVVWGMPGAVANAGAADSILPISDIGATLASLAKGGPGQ